MCAVMQVAAQVMRLLQADGHFEHEHGSKHEAQKGRAVGGDTGPPGTEEASPKIGCRYWASAALIPEGDSIVSFVVSFVMPARYIRR